MDWILHTWIVSSDLAAGWGFEREEMKKEVFLSFSKMKGTEQKVKASGSENSLEQFENI